MLLLLFGLALARLARLTTTDAITDPARAWLQEHTGDMLSYLVTCPWCLSIWYGLPGAALVYAEHGRWWVQVPLIGLAGSYLTGLLEQAIGLVTARTSLADAMRETEEAATERARLEAAMRPTLKPGPSGEEFRIGG